METEIWKDIQGYEGIYEVSNLGRVKRILKRSRTGETEIIRKTTINKIWGYEEINLTKLKITKKYKVHRLVALNFLCLLSGKPEVNHIDGNKTNNRLENLEWCNRSENVKHAYDTGLATVSKKSRARASIFCKERIKGLNPNCKKVIDIYSKIIYGSIVEAAESINISAECLRCMLRGTTKNKTTFEYYKPTL